MPRRAFLLKLGFVSTRLLLCSWGVPVLGYAFPVSVTKARSHPGLRWTTRKFPRDQTRMRDTVTLIPPWMPTADIPCWVRRLAERSFQSLPSTARTWDVRSAGFRVAPFYVSVSGGRFYEAAARVRTTAARPIRYKYKSRADNCLCTVTASDAKPAGMSTLRVRG